MTDFYQILGVERFATASQIKAAYRSLVKIWHPDINADGTAKFRQITEANAVLSDSKKRKEYDSKLSANEKSGIKASERYSVQKAKFDISVTEFLDRLSPKDKQIAKSLLKTAERLSAIKTQAHFGKVLAQVNADSQEKITELKRKLQKQSRD